MKQKPVIGLLLGDPTGIGPEIIAKLLSEKQLHGLTMEVKLTLYGKLCFTRMVK